MTTKYIFLGVLLSGLAAAAFAEETAESVRLKRIVECQAATTRIVAELPKSVQVQIADPNAMVVESVFRKNTVLVNPEAKNFVVLPKLWVVQRPTEQSPIEENWSLITAEFKQVGMEAFLHDVHAEESVKYFAKTPADGDLEQAKKDASEYNRYVIIKETTK